MSDDRSTFEVTRARLEDIVVQVRRKDVSLEQSLDMLEEAVRLVNQCNELIDQTSFRVPVPGAAGEEDAPVSAGTVDLNVVDAEGSPAAVAEAAPAADGAEQSAGDAAPPVEDEDAWGSVDAWGDEPAPADEYADDARE